MSTLLYHAVEVEDSVVSTALPYVIPADKFFVGSVTVSITSGSGVLELQASSVPVFGLVGGVQSDTINNLKFGAGTNVALGVISGSAVGSGSISGSLYTVAAVQETL